MTQQSMSLLEFQERFCDERACLDHLFRIRWPKGFACPRCGGRRFSFVSGRRLYQCSACRYQASVTAGTVFHKTRTPIRKWFWMIFMMTRQKSGVSILRMQKLLKIGAYRTAWLMGHKIREAMVDRHSNYSLAGLIEINEAIIGRQRTNKHRGGDRGKANILIGIERAGARAGFRFVGQSDRADSQTVENPNPETTVPKSESGSRRSAEIGASDKTTLAPNHDALANSGQGLSGLRWAYAVIANISGNIRGVHHGVSKKTPPEVSLGILLQIQPKTQGISTLQQGTCRLSSVTGSYMG